MRYHTLCMQSLGYPDPPTDVSAYDHGARWIAVRWTPTFDGNRPVSSFILYITSEDVFDDLTQMRTLNLSILMSAGGNFRYNVSDGTVIYPMRHYSFTIVSCNEIGCSNQSQPSPAVQTLKDGKKTEL